MLLAKVFGRGIVTTPRYSRSYRAGGAVGPRPGPHRSTGAHGFAAKVRRTGNASLRLAPGTGRIFCVPAFRLYSVAHGVSTSLAGPTTRGGCRRAITTTVSPLHGPVRVQRRRRLSRMSSLLSEMAGCRCCRCDNGGPDLSRTASRHELLASALTSSLPFVVFLRLVISLSLCLYPKCG